MTQRTPPISNDSSVDRRRFVQTSFACLAGIPALMACSQEAPKFKSTDVTGASFAQDLRPKDHNGNLRTMKDFKGKIAVVFFGFTQCPDVCPLTLADFKAVKRELGSDADRVTFMLVSIDPDRDTPAVLKRYLSVFDESFVGLTGPDERLRRIADQLDASYEKQKPDPESGAYTIAHTSFMYLFDAQGKWTTTYPFQSPPAIVAQDLRRQLASAP